jgi:hypothetical protein
MLELMRHIFSVLTLSTLVLFAGCASSPRDTSGTTPATATTAPVAAAPAAAPRMAAPVSVPAASSRKLVLVMTGPKNVIESKDWAEMKREWRETFGEHAKTAGIAYAFVDTAPAPGTEDGTLVSVNVADYRIVGIGMRILFGIMTGNAFIDAQVAFTNLRDGSKFGEQQYNTSSSAWGGIFAKVTPQQVDQIATSVMAELKSAK